MTIELGNRLASLRKEKGYSQEELAEKLGVSRQAVSKWENGEASPDTANLIALAELYDISLDELVGKAPAGSSKTEEVEGEVVDSTIAEPGSFEEEKERKAEKHLPRGAVAMTVISSVGFLLAVVAYLIVGFTWPGPTGGLGWACGWILLLLPIIISGTVSAIATRHFNRFPIAVLVVAVFCGMGIIGNAYGLNLWHPYWVMFFLIPIYHAIFSAVDLSLRNRR